MLSLRFSAQVLRFINIYGWYAIDIKILFSDHMIWIFFLMPENQLLACKKNKKKNNKPTTKPKNQDGHLLE